MVARATRKASRDTYEVEMPWIVEEGGRALYISGKVTLGGRWPLVEAFRARDQRTDEDLELPEWAVDQAEEALVDTATELWSEP